MGLSHPAWDVRRRAAELLGALGGDDAREALDARAQIEEDDLVRDALKAALTAMVGEEDRQAAAAKTQDEVLHRLPALGVVLGATA